MSFNSQHEALQLDRRRTRQTHLDLQASRTLPRIGGRDWAAHLQWLNSLTDSRSEVEPLLRVITACRIMRSRLFLGIHVFRLLLPAKHLCLLRWVSARPSDAGFADVEVRREVVSRGYRVIPIRYDRSFTDQNGMYPDVFGEPSDHKYC